MCGRQNIPLHGHCDAGTHLGVCVRAMEKFWTLLQFRTSSGDNLLREHLATAPRNATYVSPDIQNQVIQVLGDHIVRKILTNVKEAKYSRV